MVPENIRRNVRAVLLSKVGGVPMNRFLQDYKNLLCEPLNYKELGFSSLSDFIGAVPDVARLEQAGGSPVTIFGVGEPNTYMPIGARKAQGALPKNYHKNLKTKLENKPDDMDSASFAAGEPNPEPDHNGLYSVCMPKQSSPSQDSSAITGLFSQAGVVKNIYFHDNWIFVRFASLSEARNCEELFQENFGVRIARNSKNSSRLKERESNMKHEKNIKHEKKDKKHSTDKCYKAKANDMSDANWVSSGSSNDGSVSHPGSNGHDKKLSGKGHPGREKIQPKRSQQEKENSKKINTNGDPSFSDNDRHCRKNSEQKLSFSSSQDTVPQLFFTNIENEIDFRKQIDLYEPKVVKVRQKNAKTGLKIFAFVTMKSRDDAERALKELHEKMQKTQRLAAHYCYNENKESQLDESSNTAHNNDSLSSQTSLESKTQESKVNKKVLIHEVNSTDLPPLIPASEIEDSQGKYDIDCSIFVGNFPANTLESTLRQTFAPYKVFDICMVNNGNGPGCTKAFIYLPTVYDVIKAVKGLNGSVVLGPPMKVAVPFTNYVVKAVVEKMSK